jgi:hypothetical protein
MIVVKVTHLADIFQGFGVENTRKQWNTAAILEWIIALVYTFFVLSFFMDFIPAVHTKHHQSRETEDQMAMNESAVAPGPTAGYGGEDRYSQPTGYAAGRHYAPGNTDSYASDYTTSTNGYNARPAGMA